MSNHFLQTCINTKCLGMGIKKFAPYFLLDFWQLYLSIYINQEKNMKKTQNQNHTLWAVSEDLVKFC